MCMMAAEKFNACLSPFDDQKFEIKSVKIKDGDTSKVTVAIPNFVATTGRKVVVKYGTNSNNLDQEVNVTPGQPTVEISLPSGDDWKVLYYSLHATTAAAQ